METVTKVSDLMSVEDRKRFVALQAEYCKASTSTKRMREIHVEMVLMREMAQGKTPGQVMTSADACTITRVFCALNRQVAKEIADRNYEVANAISRILGGLEVKVYGVASIYTPFCHGEYPPSKR